MTMLLLALLVGVLFATGAFLILRRGQVRLILGIALLTHGVNLLLFGSGRLTRGAPPDFEEKASYLAELATKDFADPLPQALILTAIVISFGITAFLVVLVSRRDALTGSDLVPGELAHLVNAQDPFVGDDLRKDLLHEASDDYDILQFELDELYDRDLPQADIDE